jgi:hypothetical protein
MRYLTHYQSNIRMITMMIIINQSDCDEIPNTLSIQIQE